MKLLLILLLSISIQTNAATICDKMPEQITVYFEANVVQIYRLVAVSQGIGPGEHIKSEKQFWELMRANTILQLDIIQCLIDKMGTEI